MSYRDTISIGMTRQQAYSALGLPPALDRSFVEGCERQRWVFADRGLRLYFEGDALAAWHISSPRGMETALRAAGRSDRGR